MDIVSIFLISSQRIETTANIFAGVGSVILTGLLVFLYYKQHNVISTRFVEENIADVRLDNADISPFGENEPVQFQFMLSNIGDGRASDLRIRLSPSIPENKGAGVSLLDTELELTRYNNGDDYVISRGNYLNPQEKSVEFRCNASIDYSGTDGEPVLTTSIEEIPRDIANILHDDLYDTTDLEDSEIRETSISLLKTDDSNVMIPALDEPTNIPDGVELEERHLVKPKQDILNQRIDDTIGFDYIRLQAYVEYNNFKQESESRELFDYVLPIVQSAESRSLFKCGVDYDKFQEMGPGYLKQRISNHLEMDKNYSPGH